MSDLDRAIALALDAHAGQRDKAGEPYILHSLRVMLAMETEEARIVGVLHDIIEDTSVTAALLYARGFSEQVVRAVESVTRHADESYGDFIKRAAGNQIGRLVKIADINDNMDGRRLAKLPPEQADRLEAKYYRALSILRVMEVAG